MWTGAQSGLCVIKENCPLSQSRVRALTVITVETNNFPSLLRRFAQTRDNPSPIVTPGVPGSALISWGSLPGELSPAAANQRPVLRNCGPMRGQYCRCYLRVSCEHSDTGWSPDTGIMETAAWCQIRWDSKHQPISTRPGGCQPIKHRWLKTNRRFHFNVMSNDRSVDL